jgi:hypothetical protein
MRKAPMLCPRCGMKMVLGYLASSGERIFIQSDQSLDDSSLQALICTDCGYVELQAVCPEVLSRHDLSDQAADDEFSEEDEL